MRHTRIALLVLVLAAVAPYAATVTYGFVWDDVHLILENRYLRDWSELPNNLLSDFFRRSVDPMLIGYWRPVVTLSYMADRHLFRDHPWGFHLVNVLLHVVASCLVFLVARRFGSSKGVALGAGVLFAVHPVHVESVAWISGRTDLYCSLFALLALWLDLRDAEHRSRWARGGSVAATALSVLSKEMGAVVPGLIGLRALLRPGAREEGRGRLAGAVRATLPHALVVVAYGAVRFGILHIATREPAAAAVGRVVLFRTWWVGFLEYVRVLVWPGLLTVAPRIPVVRGSWSARMVGGMALLALLVVLSWRWRKKRPLLAWCTGAFLLALIPLTNFFLPINAPASIPFPWAERFLYLPSAAFSIGASWLLLAGLPGWWRRRKRSEGRGPADGPPPRWAVAVLVVLCLAAAGRTVARVRDWKDSLSLFQAAVRDTPGSTLAYLNYGVALADAGRLDEAERQYLLALQCDPGNYKVYFDLGNLAREQGDLHRAEREYRRSIASRSNWPKSHLNLGLVLKDQGRWEEALEQFAIADRLLPNYAEAKVNRANALWHLDRPKEAIPLYEEARKLEPGMAEAQLGLAGVLMQTGETERGERIVRRLIAERPDLAEAHLLLAIQLDRSGRTAEADRSYREVLRLDPGNERVRRRLGLPAVGGEPR